MALGGARPNSGRKVGSKTKKTLEKLLARDRIREFVTANLDPILEAMKEKALGVTVVDKKDPTGVRVYDLPPDPNAAKLLFEHGIGKPQENLDLTTKGRPLATPEQIIRFAKRHAVD